MTEAPTTPEPQEQRLSSYEELIRAPFVPRDIQEKWIRFEQRKRGLFSSYQALVADEDLRDEAKQARAAALEASEAPKLEQEAEELRQALLKSAESAERASLPIILNEPINRDVPTKILISQNEATQIHRRLERFKSRKGPFTPSTEDVLKEAYSKGLEMGGVRGGAIIRGALMVAEELGIDIGGSWIPRKERHMEYLDMARQRAYAASVIPTQQVAPVMPRSLQPPRRLSKRPERNRASGPVFMASPGQRILKDEDTSPTAPRKRSLQKDAAAKRKKSWK